MAIYFVWFTTALLSVGGDTSNQNLPQSGRLLYCVISGLLDIYSVRSRLEPQVLTVIAVGVLRFGFLQDGDVGDGVFSPREEIIAREAAPPSFGKPTFIS